MKYSLINYFDVWGNKKEGWEVTIFAQKKQESLLPMMQAIKRF